MSASDQQFHDHRAALVVASVSSVPADVLQSDIAVAIKQRQAFELLDDYPLTAYSVGGLHLVTIKSHINFTGK